MQVTIPGREANKANAGKQNKKKSWVETQVNYAGKFRARTGRSSIVAKSLKDRIANVGKIDVICIAIGRVV